MAQPVEVSRYELSEEEQKAFPNGAAITGAFTDELARNRPVGDDPA
ncbi:hypothetical protein ACTJKK_12905 [Microbacterium sp. 22179]